MPKSQELSEETKRRLQAQLIKLGDMMGDGVHLEPDGKWVSREYKKVARALGLMPKKDRAPRIKQINEHMAKRVQEVSCLGCGGQLKQTRSGSKRAKCIDCDNLYGLLK